jgi:hypothetical protein
LAEIFRRQDFLPGDPQHAFTASPHSAPAVQPLWTGVPLFVAFAAALVAPQHAFASWQQADPPLQHGGTAAQQLLLSAHHFSPFSQQPRRVSAAQQALFSLQQASLAEQQSLGLSSAPTVPVSSRARARNEPANSFVNME